MYVSLTPHRKYKLPFDEIGFRYWEPIIHQTASFASGILQTLRRSALWFPQFQTLPFGALSTRSLRSESFIRRWLWLVMPRALVPNS